MKRLIVSLLWFIALGLAPALAQTGTAKDKPTLNTEQGTNFPDNVAGQITPAILRQTVVDFIASWEQVGTVNAQVGTTYTFANIDTGKLVTFNNGSPVAVTLPQATTTFAVWDVTSCNKGAGLVTITPTTSTINGGATFTLGQNACSRIYSDGANYQATTLACGTGLSCTNQQIALSAARQTLPTIQTFTTGTNATYTTPANVLWIEIELVGGGGGGGGGGTAANTDGGAGGDTCWAASGTACTSPILRGSGGTGGAHTGGNGNGGGATGGNVSVDPGCDGLIEISLGTTSIGGPGGCSAFGGAGAGGTNAPGAGVAGKANTGGGGGGGGCSTNLTCAAGGGGGAGRVKHIITSPAGTYTYTVGASGSAGGAGTNGGAGGAGAGGKILVIEHYGS